MLTIAFCSFLASLSVSIATSSPIHSYPELTSEHKAKHSMNVFCYYGSWSGLREGHRKFSVESINPFLCTHLIYAFSGLSHDNRIKSLNPYMDLGQRAFKRFTNLKLLNTKLKTLISVGGWNEGSIRYSVMAAERVSRAEFIESVLKFLALYGFDGLDLDWEYPGGRGGRAEDKANFVALLRELQEAFRGRGYLLTTTVGPTKEILEQGYRVKEISRYVDFMNVQCYDYHGPWENTTGLVAPLFKRPGEPVGDIDNNVNFTINYLLSQGVSPSKVIMGMGTYGRTANLVDPRFNGLNAPIYRKGEESPSMDPAKALGYNEVCYKVMAKNWTVVHDPYQMSPYAFNWRQWLSYEDLKSISFKAVLVKYLGIGGAMIWSLDNDDFTGGCHQTKFPMITMVNKVFERTSAKEQVPLSHDSSTRPAPSHPRPQVSAHQHSTTPSPAHPTRDPSHPSHPNVQPHPRPFPSPPANSAPVHPHPHPTAHICNGPGFKKHPTNCHKYYNCASNRLRGYSPVETTCPTGTAFSVSESKCVPMRKVLSCFVRSSFQSSPH